MSELTDKEMEIKNEFMGWTNFHAPEEEIKWLRTTLITEREEHARTREELADEKLVCNWSQETLGKYADDCERLEAELNTARERIKELEGQ